jgi:hypothetical protein
LTASSYAGPHGLGRWPGGTLLLPLSTLALNCHLPLGRGRADSGSFLGRGQVPRSTGPLHVEAGPSPGRYRTDVAENDAVIGDDPLIDGMRLSVRLRYDFAVSDASRLLAAARRIYQDLNPGAGADETDAMVTCAADALFVVLEHAGLFGAGVDEQLAAYRNSGLEVSGSRAQVVPNEPCPLSGTPRGDCLRTEDVFALPADKSGE